ARWPSRTSGRWASSAGRGQRTRATSPPSATGSTSPSRGHPGGARRASAIAPTSGIWRYRGAGAVEAARSRTSDQGSRKSMNDRKTMTLNLTEREMAILEELSRKKTLSKTAVIRQALRLYRVIDERLTDGDKLFLEDEAARRR